MTDDAWLKGRKTLWNEEWHALWAGINDYVTACGGNPNRAQRKKQRAQAAEHVENILAKVVSSAMQAPDIPDLEVAAETLEQRVWNLFVSLLQTESALVGDASQKKVPYAAIAVRTPDGVLTCETMLSSWAGLTIGRFTARYFMSWAENQGYLSEARYRRVCGVKKRWRKVLL